MRRAVILLLLLAAGACGSDGMPDPDAAAVDAPPGSADARPADAGAQTACGPDLSCDPVTEICVQDIGIVTSYRCAPVPSGCEADRDCGCAGIEICGPATTCRDVAADNTIECCPKC